MPSAHGAPDHAEGQPIGRADIAEDHLADMDAHAEIDGAGKLRSRLGELGEPVSREPRGRERREAGLALAAGFGHGKMPSTASPMSSRTCPPEVRTAPAV